MRLARRFRIAYALAVGPVRNAFYETAHRALEGKLKQKAGIDQSTNPGRGVTVDELLGGDGPEKLPKSPFDTND